MRTLTQLSASELNWSRKRGSLRRLALWKWFSKDMRRVGYTCYTPPLFSDYHIRYNGYSILDILLFCCRLRRLFYTGGAAAAGVAPGAGAGMRWARDTGS
eukprot:1863829-Rhodomonas_salina.1